MWSRLVPAAALTVVVYGQTAAPSRDYTQWRGRERDGSVSGFVEPATWPNVLTRKWKVDVGEGYGTPLVVGDLVYVFTRREGREELTALDAGTGARRWHTSYAAPYTVNDAAAKHGPGPKSTPLVYGGRRRRLVHIADRRDARWRAADRHRDAERDHWCLARRVGPVDVSVPEQRRGHASVSSLTLWTLHP